MAKKKALTNQHTTDVKNLSKEGIHEIQHYQEFHIEKMIEKLSTFVEDHPEAKEIQEFYNAHHIPRSTYYGLLERWPELKEAHKMVMHKLGGRLWGRCVDFKANWNAVKFMIQSYAPEYAQAKEYDAMLAAKARESANASDGPQIVVIEKFANSDIVPEKNHDRSEATV